MDRKFNAVVRLKKPSLIITIPASFAARHGIAEGTAVKVEILEVM